MFVVALVMLLSAPIIYLILSILALASVGLKKYPHCHRSSPINLRRVVLDHFKHRLH